VFFTVFQDSTLNHLTFPKVFLCGIFRPVFWSWLSPFSRLHDHTQTHRTRYDSSLDEWSARRRDLCLTTHKHSQETDIHAPGGIWTHNPSKRTAEDPRLRPRGHWGQQIWNNGDSLTEASCLHVRKTFTRHKSELGGGGDNGVTESLQMVDLRNSKFLSYSCDIKTDQFTVLNPANVGRPTILASFAANKAASHTRWRSRLHLRDKIWCYKLFKHATGYAFILQRLVWGLPTQMLHKR
jgi:hypothetical protein